MVGERVMDAPSVSGVLGKLTHGKFSHNGSIFWVLSVRKWCEDSSAGPTLEVDGEAESLVPDSESAL